MIRLVIAVVMACGALTGHVSAQIPDVLNRSLELRRSFQTASLRYRLKLVGPWGDELRNFESQIAGAAFIVIDRGNDDGIMTYSAQSGLPNLGMKGACGPIMQLVDRGGDKAWYFQEGSTSATTQSATEASALDIRVIGLEPFPLGSDVSSVAEMWREYFPEKQHWRVRPEGEMVLVVAEREFDLAQAPKHRQRWSLTIDPKRDDAITSILIEVLIPGQAAKIWGQGETRYAWVDGHWIPSEFSGWREGSKGQTLRAEYELLEASLDKENHPRQLTVDMLKIPGGTFVGTSSPGRRDVRVWNGKSAISREKWLETHRPLDAKSVDPTLYGRQKADHFRYPAWWYDETGSNGLDGVATKPNNWEAYVRRWCIRHAVNDKQRTAAKGILDDCRKEAHAYLEKHRQELEKLESQSTKSAHSAEVSKGEVAERDRLLRPISAIFDRLKSRLDPLLLQEQVNRNSARSQPKSAAVVPAPP